MSARERRRLVHPGDNSSFYTCARCRNGTADSFRLGFPCLSYSTARFQEKQFPGLLVAGDLYPSGEAMITIPGKRLISCAGYPALSLVQGRSELEVDQEQADGVRQPVSPDLRTWHWSTMAQPIDCTGVNAQLLGILVRKKRDT